MATKKKLLQAAAGSAGGAALNVEDVFSTYLYKGTGATLEINNGIDLSGEGGLVWQKVRSSAGYRHFLFDTERTFNKYISSNTTDAESSLSALSSFDSDGVTLTSDGNVNGSGIDSVLWSFRKAPKFFDVVTYTGTGGSRTLNHNLGSTPGCIIVKDISNAGENWTVYHRGLNVNSDNAPETDGIYLNLTNAAIDESGFWNDTAPTSTQFTVGANLNSSFGGGANYVAYLFAHNNGDGEFGSTADQDIIKCGSVSYNAGATVDLGFEPQWVLIKPSNNAGSWILNDNMRGMPNGSRGPWLLADSSLGENANATVVYPTPTGFTIPAFIYDPTDLIYIAIRRGPMAVPESATDVFDVVTRTGDATVRSTVPVNISVVDSVLNLTRSGSEAQCLGSRIAGNTFMFTNTSQAEVPISKIYWDYSDSFAWDDNNGNLNSSTYVDYAFKRAPNYFDVVAYTGTGSARTVSHNLGVAPEMMWVKRRSASEDWNIYHKDLLATEYLQFNTDAATTTNGTLRWNSTRPTDSVFSVGTHASINASSSTYIAYLFASLAGISKVGSYTGNGTSQTIDCGFTSGARFVLIKRTNGTGNWIVFDTARGIVSGTDPQLFLNTTDAEDTGHDLVDPASSGFVVNNDNTAFSYQEVNANGAEYIFYAIA